MAADVNAAVLRLIDASANRAREGMRVQEDYARFVLDAPELCREIKEIRHGLAAALMDVLPEAILHRDTPGDVGTAIKTQAERTRQGLCDIVTAAGKRLGEALRALEEFLKTLDAEAAGRVESLRYRSYEVERRLALTLRPDNRFSAVRLYVLISESACSGPWLKTAEQALAGGADCLQLREKALGDRELLSRARRLGELCRQYQSLLIVNDRPDIAAIAGADGVHLGQDDLPAAEVRRQFGNRLLIGVSTHNLQQARQAVLDGADYIGVGPIFKSATKPRDFVAGLEYAAAAAAAVPVPTIGIAGITLGNVDEVMQSGVSAVAVAAAVAGCEDVQSAAEAMKKKVSEGQARFSAGKSGEQARRLSG